MRPRELLARAAAPLIVQWVAAMGAAQAAPAEAARQQPHRAPVAYVGGTIIDGNGGPLIEDGVLVIEGERIAAVGGRGTPIPAQARKVDVRNKYLMPGLMDANVHLLIDVS